ncbi:MAG: hypothetical protein JWQ08_2661 [Deinococcus sp.]|nr:hypothetical protein [Deinococcus sp.]
MTLMNDQTSTSSVLSGMENDSYSPSELVARGKFILMVQGQSGRI